MFDLSALSDRVAGILRSAVGALALMGPKGTASGPVLVAIHRCIERRLWRFRRLMARVAAGAVSTRAAAGRGSPHPLPAHEGEGDAGGRAARRVSLVPRGYAWAVKMAQETASFGSQLQALLAEPGVPEMLAQHPEAVVILKPLCRMLAAELPEAVRPARRVRKARIRRVFPIGEHSAREDRRLRRETQERWEAISLAAAKRAVRPPWR